MGRLSTLSVSLVLLLIAFPLISIGTTSGPPMLWWIGLGALAVGGILPPLRRFSTQSEPPSEPTKAGRAQDAPVP